MDGGKEFQNDTVEYVIECRLFASDKYGIRSLLSWQVSWLSILILIHKNH